MRWSRRSRRPERRTRCGGSARSVAADDEVRRLGLRVPDGLYALRRIQTRPGAPEKSPHAFHGFVPTAEWWGHVMKKVPSASAWARADCHCRASSGVSLPTMPFCMNSSTVSYTHLRAHETPEHLVCRLLLE